MNGLQDILETISHAPIRKSAITNRSVLNEPFHYPKALSFSREMRVDLNGVTILVISGPLPSTNTATAFTLAISAPMRRTLANITGLLAIEGATWRDIERDYDAFNEEHTKFYAGLGLNLLPASTRIQAILCRPELLIEIEAIAMFRTEKPKANQ